MSIRTIENIAIIGGTTGAAAGLLVASTAGVESNHNLGVAQKASDAAGYVERGETNALTNETIRNLGCVGSNEQTLTCLTETAKQARVDAQSNTATGEISGFTAMGFAVMALLALGSKASRRLRASWRG